MKIIEVTVSPTGQTTVQTKGFTGADCQEASRFLEQSLGLTTGERKTDEFYASAQSEQQVRQ